MVMEKNKEEEKVKLQSFEQTIIFYNALINSSNLMFGFLKINKHISFFWMWECLWNFRGFLKFVICKFCDFFCKAKAILIVIPNLAVFPLRRSWNIVSASVLQNPGSLRARMAFSSPRTALHTRLQAAWAPDQAPWPGSISTGPGAETLVPCTMV